MDTTVDHNLELFKNLISCHTNIYLSTYDKDGTLISSTCPEEELYHKMLVAVGYMDDLRSYAGEHTLPMDMGTSIGLSWIAVFERQDGQLYRIHLVGPAFTTDVSFDSIRDIVHVMLHDPDALSWRSRLLRSMESLPVVSPILWTEYAVMLHYCTNGQKISRSDVARRHDTFILGQQRPSRRDRHKTYAIEQAILKSVREGNLNYQDAMNRAGLVSEGVPLHTKDPLRQAKNSVIVFTSLCVRAAIEGGMSPEQAYSLGDSYIQGVEDARTTTDAGAISHLMMDDFVHRVHNLHTNPNLSKPIRQCCDYIQMHAEDKIRIETLAEYTGYTDYYLSRKFKAEMNVSINDYIKTAKIERAKFLLTTTDISIQELSERLNFCSRSHFGEVFRKIAGCSPAEYREDTAAADGK